MLTTRPFIASFFAILFSLQFSFGQTTAWNEVDKIVASDRQANARFGGLGNGVKTLSIHGDYAVVGAEGNDHSGLTDAGAAYVYKRNASEGWDFYQKLVANNPQAYALFGSSVAISEYEDFIVIGSPDYDAASFTGTISDCGIAYLFQRNGLGVWTQVQTLSPANQDIETNARFGNSVDITTRRVIVGAFRESQDPTLPTLGQSGAAYIFERNGTANVWNLIQKLTASDRAVGNQFGSSVAISGDYAVVGAPKNNLDANGGNPIVDAGASYIFEKNGYAPWTEVNKITSTDRNNNEKYGTSVDIDGDYIIVGATGDDTDEFGLNYVPLSGSAFIYARSSGTGTWGLQSKVVANDRQGNDFFGLSVGIDEIGYAVVGTYLEDHDEAGGNFMSRAGSSYIYEHSGSSLPLWSQYQKIVASDRSPNDEYGASVSIDQKYILVSARLEDHDETGANFISNAGSAYAYKLETIMAPITKTGMSDDSPTGAEISQISLAPNPSTGMATLTFTEFDSRDQYHITIYDCAGRIVLQDVITQESYQMDLSDHENGLFMIELKDGTSTKRLKLLVVK